MKRRMFSYVALGALALLARPGTAQQEKPPAAELLPPPAAVEVPAAPSCAGGECAPPCAGGIKVLWAEHEVPIRRIEPREIEVKTKRPTVVVDYWEKECTVIDYVVKEREVERLAPCTVLQPCTVTDPHTGHCTTVMKPVTEMRPVKDVVCCTEPVTKTVKVKVPYLKQVEEEVKQKVVIFEYKTVMKKEGCPVVMPAPEVPKTRYLLAEPPCQPDGHP